MPWIKSPNVAMYGGANWNTYIKTVPNSSPEQAKRIALLDPNISFFFFCRSGIEISDPSWPAPRRFNSGDAAFFSGKPWYGNAPQCDSYQKNGMSIAYINNITPALLNTAGCYVTADGGSGIDVVCIFNADINASLQSGYTALAPKVDVPPGGSYACAEANVVQTLQSTAIQQLQSLGITVLLSVLNNHDSAGWSEFTDPELAQNFVDQLKSVVTQYNLDGIDIDDEYSDGTANTTSLAMVTSMMQKSIPGKIISKALFQDLDYFGVPYKGVTLEQTLTYGWEMSYGGSPEYRLPPYVKKGMRKNTLSLGFWTGQPSRNPGNDVDWLKKNGYEGVMVYVFQIASETSLMGTLVNAWCGPGNWNKKPNCPLDRCRISITLPQSAIVDRDSRVMHRR
ncbi:MAG: glycosyl hydrolase family 18 protein [Candidatus Sulfotelmatobacter sp.]